MDEVLIMPVPSGDGGVSSISFIPVESVSPDPQPLVADNAGPGSFTAYQAIITGIGYFAKTGENFTYDNNLRYDVIEAPALAVGDVIYVSFVHPMFQSALGLSLFNDGGVYKYRLGNLAGGDFGSFIAFPAYAPGDELAILVDADHSANGTVFLRKNGVAVDSFSMLNPVAAPPTAFGVYGAAITQSTTVNFKASPTYPIAGALFFGDDVLSGDIDENSLPATRKGAWVVAKSMPYPLVLNGKTINNGDALFFDPDNGDLTAVANLL
jgi:hypothetical protein